MDSITDVPPKKIKDEIAALNLDLDQAIPKSTAKNVIIATWNLRAFGDLTDKWEAAENDSPKRDLQSLLSITEILKRFDIIAVQEVKGNIKCLRHAMKKLGDEWSFLMTDVVQGDPGNSERLAFIFRNTKVKLSGLAGEIVISKEQLEKNITAGALQEQFARTPYAVSFKAGEKTFVLLTLHVVYGKKEEDRIPEINAIAEWIKGWAEELFEWDHSLITLGDFNIEKKDDEAFKAFISKGLFVPEELKTIPRMLGSVSFFDQLAWFRDEKKKQEISLEFKKAGSYNFSGKVLMSRKYTNSQLSYRISDHLPLWAEFGV
jgi:endonuclease/exonuclease/phosphatase family metal-dependent hydrolase